MARPRKAPRPGTQEYRLYMARLGRAGGPAGGHARAETLPPAERREIARHAALARWGKRRPKG